MMISPASSVGFCHILGIRFLMGGYEEAHALLSGGRLMIVPSAPSLAYAKEDEIYHEALKGSDFAIPDSSFMVLLIRAVKGIKLRVISGLKFLHRFLDESELKQSSGRLFLVDPSAREKTLNQRYLLSKGIAIDDADHYVAPWYPKSVQDAKLLALVQSRKPRYILINLGGGVQEKLGLYLKSHLDYRPGILCTGAAIAFLTGSQAAISPLADNLQIGWLVRCLDDPGQFVPRYLKSLSLISLILKRRHEIFISEYLPA